MDLGLMIFTVYSAVTQIIEDFPVYVVVGAVIGFSAYAVRRFIAAGR